MKLKTTNDLLATDKGGLITYCQDLHIEIERMRTDATRYWRSRVERAVDAEREACATVCDMRAEHNEKEAAVADEDEQSNLRSAAWQMSVCAAEIRARGEKGGE